MTRPSTSDSPVPEPNDPAGAEALVAGWKDGDVYVYGRTDANGMVQLVRQYRAGRIVKINGSKTDR